MWMQRLPYLHVPVLWNIRQGSPVLCGGGRPDDLLDLHLASSVLTLASAAECFAIVCTLYSFMLCRAAAASLVLLASCTARAASRARPSAVMPLNEARTASRPAGAAAAAGAATRTGAGAGAGAPVGTGGRAGGSRGRSCSGAGSRACWRSRRWS